MGAKYLVMLKTQIDSINLCFSNDFVYENVLCALASLWLFLCDYVLYSLALILRYIFRFQAEDRKIKQFVPVVSADETKRNELEDSKIDGFTEELANLLFPRCENFDIPSDEETESSVVKKIDSDICEEDKKIEGETDGSVFMETVSEIYEDKKKDENETECSVFMEVDSAFYVHENGMKTEEAQEEKEETEGLVLMDTDSATTTIKSQFANFASQNDLVETPTTMTFTFKEIYLGAKVSDNAFSSTENISNAEFKEHNLLEGPVSQEQETEDSVLKQRTFTFTSNSNSGQISFQSNDIGGSDSSDGDYILYENSLPPNSSPKPCEAFDSEKIETQFPCDKDEMEGSSYHENGFDEMDFNEEEDEDELEWERDELLEQMQLELRNARQGGLATILEEEEEESDETESPKVVVEDLKPLKIEDQKIEYKDHMVEIHKVYRSYAEKIRKLDVLNYQTLNAIGLLQLKDPLKLTLMPKSTVQGAKPQKSQNLWPRKAQKHISDPMHKFLEELHKDLEFVYVGQICLSWEILCWQHKKLQELKQFDSQWQSRRYNIVAGEFQLFQVLMQRFTEDEPFQGPRIQNYVKTRCVIRNLLRVPPIKDDNTKDKKKMKWDEEDAISIERLEEIIKESMWVFWEFVRADKDYYGNMIFKVSHQNRNDVNDPAVSDLLRDIRTQLQKKERKLKEIVRSGNCIIRKFQKQNQDKVQLDHEQLLAQVGLRLISRVVNMKRFRKDQLLWCNDKLNRITFVGRKVQVEPSFLLFPF